MLPIHFWLQRSLGNGTFHAWPSYLLCGPLPALLTPTIWWMNLGGDAAMVVLSIVRNDNECLRGSWSPDSHKQHFQEMEKLCGEEETTNVLLNSLSSKQNARVGKDSPFLLFWSSTGKCLLLDSTVFWRLQSGTTADPSHVPAPYMHSHGIPETDANWLWNKSYHHGCYGGGWPGLWKVTLPNASAGVRPALIGFGCGAGFLAEKIIIEELLLKHKTLFFFLKMHLYY